MASPENQHGSNVSAHFRSLLLIRFVSQVSDRVDIFLNQVDSVYIRIIP